MKLFHHPNIIYLKDIMTMNNLHYMIFEYVSGGQMLDYIIAHGKLREKLARKFFRQIVSAVGKEA
jgi:serine/threonine protein kinase